MYRDTDKEDEYPDIFHPAGLLTYGSTHRLRLPVSHRQNSDLMQPQSPHTAPALKRYGFPPYSLFSRNHHDPRHRIDYVYLTMPETIKKCKYLCEQLKHCT